MFVVLASIMILLPIAELRRSMQDLETTMWAFSDWGLSLWIRLLEEMQLLQIELALSSHIQDLLHSGNIS